MKIHVVYLWEPYELPCYHKYFLSKESAESYYHAQLKEEAFWDIDEVETED